MDERIILLGDARRPGGARVVRGPFRRPRQADPRSAARRAGLAGLGDWTADHQDASGTWVDANGQSYSDFTAAVGGLFGTSAPPATGGGTALDFGNQAPAPGGPSLALDFGAPTPASAPAPASSPSEPSTADKVAGGFLDFGKALVPSAAAVGVAAVGAAAPKVVSSAVQKWVNPFGQYVSPPKQPPPPPPPKTNWTPWIVGGGIALTIVLGLGAVFGGATLIGVSKR